MAPHATELSACSPPRKAIVTVQQQSQQQQQQQQCDDDQQEEALGSDLEAPTPLPMLARLHSKLTSPDRYRGGQHKERERGGRKGLSILACCCVPEQGA